MTNINSDWWDQFIAGRRHGEASAIRAQTDVARSYFSAPSSHLRLMDAADRNDPKFAFEVGWLAGYAEGQGAQQG
jgi:hypothetical protein